MRSALLAASVVVTATIAAYACSSSTEPAADPDAGASSSSGSTSSSTSSSGDEGSTSSSGSTSSNSGSGSSSGSTSSSSGTTTSSSGDGGNTSTSSSGFNFDAGGAQIPDGGRCVPASTPETEDNGTAGTATAVPLAQQTGFKQGSFCATASPADTDFMTFTLPVGSTSLKMRQEGSAGITIEATADGEVFPFNGNYLFKPGKPYVLKVTTTAASADYRIDIEVTP